MRAVAPAVRRVRRLAPPQRPAELPGPAPDRARPAPRPPRVRRAFQERFLPDPRRRVPGHRPDPGRDPLLPDRARTRRRRTGASSRRSPAASSSWAIRSSRSTASGAPTSRPTAPSATASRRAAGSSTLTANFRSTGRLCDWVNGVFAQQFPADGDAAAGRLGAARGAARRGRARRLPPRDAHDAARPARAVVEQDADADRARDRRRRRARASARPDDFLVLFRTRKFMSDYARALEARGHPLRALGRRRLQGLRGARRRCLPLLAAISDPDDPVAVHGRPARPALRRRRRGAVPPLPRRRTLFVPRRAARGRRSAHRARLRAPARRRGAGRATLPPGAAIARICARPRLDRATRARGSSATAAPGNLLKAIAAARTFSADGLDFGQRRRGARAPDAARATSRR